MGLLNYLRRIREEDREEKRERILQGIRNGSGMTIFPHANYKMRDVAEYWQTARDAGYLAEVLPDEEERQLRELHEAAGIRLSRGWWVLTWEKGQPRPDPHESLRKVLQARRRRV